MKFTLLILLVIPFFACAQIDTLHLNDGRTVAATGLQIFQDRITFEQNGISYFVGKNSINAINLREEKVLPSGEIGWNYNNNIAVISGKGWPEFKNSKYYLREAGIQGIFAGSLIVGGSLAAGIATAFKDTKTTLAGTIIAATGFVLIIPTSVFIFKAGKQKDYRQY